MVGPRAEREAVRVAREEARLSERHACGLIGMHRGSWRYGRRAGSPGGRGDELAGVVFAKDREILRSLGLETLLASSGPRVMRLIVRRCSPELAAIRRLLASRFFDFDSCDFEGHAVLFLRGTYEQLLRSFRGTMRRNFRTIADSQV